MDGDAAVDNPRGDGETADVRAWVAHNRLTERR